MDSEKRAKIIEGRTELIGEVLSRLFEFDNGGGQGRLALDGANSEINFAGPGAALNQNSVNGDRDYSSNGRGALNNIDSTNISVTDGAGLGGKADS